MRRRFSARACVPALAAVLLATALGPSPARAAVTLGADLARPAGNQLTCAVLPLPIPYPTGASSCTWFTTSATFYPPSETNIVPQDAGGYGVITKVRIRTGAATGPMQVVTFRSMRQSQSTGEPGCCWPQYATPVFTPAAGGISEIATQLPVINVMTLSMYLPFLGQPLPSGPNTDPYGGIHEAPTGVQGIQNYDQIALSVLDPTVPIPAQYDGSPNVSSGLFWPALQSTEMRLLTTGSNGNGSSFPGVHVLLQAVWEPDVDHDGLGDETQDPNVVVPGTPGNPGAPGTPGTPAAPAADRTAPVLTVTASRPRLATLRRSGLLVTVRSNEGATATARLRLAATTARRLGLTRGRTAVTVGSVTAKLTAGAARRLHVVLTSRARRALGRVRSVRLTLEVRGVDGAGNRATRTSALTVRR